MLDYSTLPPELWLLILKEATTSERRADFIDPVYTPFQPAPHDTLDPAIAVRAKISVVCREWHGMAIRLLYEDVRISKGIPALRDSLAQHGGLVRRLILPYRATVTMPSQDPELSFDILRLCTNLETLVRPQLNPPGVARDQILQFHFEAADIPLTSLKRLDWWYFNEAERSGGINSLHAVLRNAPNIEFLSVGGVAGHGLMLHGRYPLILPKLRTITLRLGGANGFFPREMSQLWSLPTLVNIVVENPPQIGLSHIWETFGAQLRVVEFGKHLRFMLEDYISPCLHDCRNLEELNFNLFFTMPPAAKPLRHSSIVRIGLHASVNQLFRDGREVCNHIEKHFALFLDDTFPALQKLILHGEWRGIISHPHLAQLWQALNKRGIIVTSLGCPH